LFKFGHLLVGAIIVSILLGVISPDEALALRTQPRPGWMAGVGWGMGWAGPNEVPIPPGEEQGSGDRVDEWGWGLSAEGGYEFWRIL
jgi:hypothetical protein